MLDGYNVIESGLPRRDNSEMKIAKGDKSC